MHARVVAGGAVGAFVLGSAGAMAAAAGAAPGGKVSVSDLGCETVCQLDHTHGPMPAHRWAQGEHRVDDPRELASKVIELAVFNTLPIEMRLAIPEEHLPELADLSTLRDAVREGEAVEYERVAGHISREAFERINPVHRLMLARLVEGAASDGPPIALCFTPGTDPEFVHAVSELLYGDQGDFQQVRRWTSTATNGSVPNQFGVPVTLTYSFVPDGTNVPNTSGLPGGPSQLFVWLDGIYGNTANWQQLFHEEFDRWGDLSGVEYVFEPNDSGTSIGQSNGQLGVRGDVRIAAVPLDGNGGVLAYNFFPNVGDMVFDAFDSFYNNTGSNNVRMRNVISHEHGHGLGQAHVCPANGTKLMEPFINTGFLGPQLDDIQNAQRYYGDPLTPNGTPASATPLGQLSDGTVGFDLLSLDRPADRDFFSFSVNEVRQATVRVIPVGQSYLEGPQTQQCNTGSTRDSLRVLNPSIRLLASNGTTVLATASSAGLGETETLSFTLPEAGSYFVEVFTTTSTNDIQLYNFRLEIDEPPFLGPVITLPDGPPAFVQPGEFTEIAVSIDPRDDQLVPGSAVARYRVNGGAFSTVALDPQSGNMYTAALPPITCDDELEFFFSVRGDEAGLVLLPEGAPTQAYASAPGSFEVRFDDNFETDKGWTVFDTPSLTDGTWERGVPIPWTVCNRGNPPSDYDGSGQCYLTANRATPSCNSDVDEGATILTSPAIDASGGEAILSYARWFSNTRGNNPGVDPFDVEVSNDDGATWTLLERVGPNDGQNDGGWFFVSFVINDVFPEPSEQFRVRFIASDLGPQAIVEAAVDAVSLTVTSCEDPAPACPADLNGDGVVDADDFFLFLQLFAAGDPAADINGDGVIDADDFFEYLGLFAQGC
ncbi:MAG: matrixin family metalloprotease [Phycisphaerales bacterium]|nr:matrixin family metalloprotease [Phycisphaerales bacterium]